jgi:hypothetical protein
MSGTARTLRYECEACHDSGLVFSRTVHLDDLGFALPFFAKCTACDGKSRLCGEIDEPAPETPALDKIRNLKHGGPA